MAQQEDAKKEILSTLLSSFNAMPSWLKNALIVTLCLGFFYYGYARKEIIYSKEKETTTEIYTKINTLNKKIEKIEDIRIANEDMVYNIEEVRGIVAVLSALHEEEVIILTSHLQTVLGMEDYRKLMRELTEADIEYKKHVNELFEKKTREHLRNSRGASPSNTENKNRGS